MNPAQYKVDNCRFFYDTIVVDEREGDGWFCTELEAIVQGWKRSNR